MKKLEARPNRIIMSNAVKNIFLIFLGIISSEIVLSQVYKDQKTKVEDRINDLIGRMTMEEKALLLHPNFFSTRGNERLGIPQLKFIDGSYGARCGQSTSFSTSINYAATWDTELVTRVGIALADEIKTKNRNMLLGPVIIMHRIPQGGRNAESYGEDPYLSGTIVSTYIKAIQSQNIATTAAFPGAKTQEYHTSFYDARVDERTLNEIYFPAFRMAVEEGKVWGIMTPYNRVNGVRVANSNYILNDMLHEKWGFSGLVMTDWAGVRNFEESILAGLDLDMSDGRQYTVEKLTRIYKGAENNDEFYKLMANRLDGSVRRILRVMFSNGMFEEKPLVTQFDTLAHRELALQVARESITLLKNEGNILPLDKEKIKTIAVIGPNTDVCRHSIMFASRVLPYTETTPLEGIINKVGDNIKVLQSQGCFIDDEGRFFTDKEVKTTEGRKGFFVEFFDNLEMKGKPVFTNTEHLIGYHFQTNAAHPETEEGDYSLRASGIWTPTRSGYYYVFAKNGELTVNELDEDTTEDLAQTSETKLNTDESQKAELDRRPAMHVINDRQYRYFEKGKPYRIVAEFKRQRWNNFEIRYKFQEEDALKNAIEIACQADVAVLFLGFSETLEREERDRSPGLPENQLKLLKAVKAVNPNLIVALNSGSGVSINPWGDGARAILEAYYPGQEGGTAIADILFGDVNPSGKLPFTCMKDWSDSPVYGHYPDGPDAEVDYVEGIYVGYRWFDRPDTPEAAFPFGHGLSYTTFGYSDLKISPDTTTTDHVTATLNVSNTGKKAGAEVVQLYIGDDHASVDRPVKELKGYKRVFLNPGETQAVTFNIQPDDLKFYDITIHDWKAEPGSFTVYIGSSSTDIRLTGKFLFSFSL